MNLFHDRPTDRLILRQEHHPLGAAVMLMFAIGFLGLAVFIVREHNDLAAWLLAGLTIGGGIYLLWHGLLLVTETVATFDAAARTLTIRRTRPWRVASQSASFDDVAYIEAQARGRWTGYGGDIPGRQTYHGIEITLAGERKLWMYEAKESECYDMARQIMTMIRRPKERSA